MIGFEASRVWISSANFTSASRTHLEFGYWTEDPALVQGAERFLVKLMRSSEGLDPEADSFDPDLAPSTTTTRQWRKRGQSNKPMLQPGPGDRSDEEDGLWSAV